MTAFGAPQRISAPPAALGSRCGRRHSRSRSTVDAGWPGRGRFARSMDARSGGGRESRAAHEHARSFGGPGGGPALRRAGGGARGGGLGRGRRMRRCRRAVGPGENQGASGSGGDSFCGELGVVSAGAAEGGARCRRMAGCRVPRKARVVPAGEPVPGARVVPPAVEAAAVPRAAITDRGPGPAAERRVRSLGLSSQWVTVLAVDHGRPAQSVTSGGILAVPTPANPAKVASGKPDDHVGCTSRRACDS